MILEQRAEIKFSLAPGNEIMLATAQGVFAPTGTTNLLLKAVKKAITGTNSLLDLGCGTGVVGLALHLEGLVNPPLYASDLSESAVICSRENFVRYSCPADVRVGSLFEPWSGERFDVIVDDISGVAQDVAAVSPWFKGVPCETGKDGVDLVVKILRDAPSHLADQGRFES